MRNTIKTSSSSLRGRRSLACWARARRGQAARRRDDRDARRSQPPGRRRSRRGHVAVARLPGPALRRGQAVAGARAQPRRRAGPRRPGSGGRLVAAAGAAVAQREDPARAAGEHRRVDGDHGPRTSRTCRPISCARWATSTRSATRTTGSRPRTRAPSRGCWPSASPRSTPAGAAAYKAGAGALRGAARRPRRSEWEGAAAPLQRHARRHVPQELVVRRALAGDGGGRLHRAEARHPADRQPHRAAGRADEEVGVRLVVVESFYPSTTGEASSPTTAHARLVAAPSNVGATPAIKTYFDLVDAVIAALKTRLTLTRRGRGRGRGRRRRRR